MRTGGSAVGAGPQRGLVLLVIGYLAVMVSLALAYQGPENEFTGPPTCDGEVMSPGDRCITFRVGRTGADSSSQTYEEALASQRISAKETPWLWGTVLGTLGTVLIFTGAGRGLLAYQRSGREVFTRVAATAAVPLLVVSGVVGWLELRYDRDLREQSLFLVLPGEVPGGPVLMVALVGLATAITYGGVRSSYEPARRQAQLRAEEAARPRETPRYAPPAGSPYEGFFPRSARTGSFPGQPPGGATPTAGGQFQDYFHEFFQPLPRTGADRPAGASTASAGAATSTPGTAQKREQPAPRAYDVPIGLLRVGQLLASLAGALWIGSVSGWHWGCVLLVLAGGVVVTLMGTEHAPGVQLAFQFVVVVLQAGAIAFTAWIGGLSDWHSGIIAGFWGGTAAVAYAAATVTQHRSGPTAEMPPRRLYLPPASLVPLALLAIAAAATVPLGDQSGWRWDTVLALWLGVSVAAVAHSAITEVVPYPTGRSIDRVHLSGLVPVGLVLAVAAVSRWLVAASGGHPGPLLLAVWGGVCVVVVVEAVAVARRTRSQRATAVPPGPQRTGPDPATSS